ncbi:MAG TPA: dTDP-4-dehydrorhamnose reductase [Bacteroidales bacterium]|jgi:dTDP-4-dehydrorhamnose reductase|nr:dTDP-4-dehydrorhamnose reductase [Bacteroidales bacterium]
MAVILVTGSAGQLGNELKVSSKNYPGYEFIFTDIDTLDITDKVSLNETITRTRPDWIINCVAYNFVDKAETNRENAFRINSIGPKNIADAIRGTDCKFIHISTDYVFDGDSTSPYNESASANPQSVYGRSKLEGEINALQYPHTMIIRTSWLYSSFGSNFVKTILSHGKEKDVLDVVFDQTGTPTYAADLADAVLSIASKVIRNQYIFIAGIYHYSNEGVCSWYDFATEIVSEAGLSCRVNPILSKDFTSAARRPAYSVLDKSKIKETYGIEIPHWRTSLQKCMELLW